MSFTCTQVCHDILPRFSEMCQNPVELQYSTQFRYLQPGEAGQLGERILGGGHVPAMVTRSVLLGLKKTCTLLFRDHCLELPLSWMLRGSCRSATFLECFQCKIQEEWLVHGQGTYLFYQGIGPETAPLHFLFQAQSWIHLYLQNS